MSTQRRITIGILLVAAAVALWAFFYVPADDNPYPTDPGAISVLSFTENARVGETFTLEGEATGSWFFDGVMPVYVEDGSGTQIWEGVAIAQDDSLQNDFIVPFTADIDLGSYTGPAKIVFVRNNVGEDPIYDKQYSISVTVVEDAPVED